MILNEAWKDPDWGVFILLSMTTGARRGEVCGVRWPHLDLDASVVRLHRSIAQIAGDVWEKDTKTHQQRRVTLDPEITDILRAHRTRCEQRASDLGTRIRRDGFVFSPAPDCSIQIKPNTMTQRYGRLAARLGIDTHLNCLRHYSATELIAAGVDIRTVAGRLGHSGGGSTTLRAYTAFQLEAEQRASSALAARRPRPPRSA
ncbi:MAG: site-specific integrase [Pseudonocardia sp.]|nr:site-specific integrase [Pseudonocardia sp.]